MKMCRCVRYDLLRQDGHAVCGLGGDRYVVTSAEGSRSRCVERCAAEFLTIKGASHVYTNNRTVWSYQIGTHTVERSAGSRIQGSAKLPGALRLPSPSSLPRKPAR